MKPLVVLLRKLAAQQAIQGKACLEVSTYLAELDARNAFAQTESASLGGSEQALEAAAQIRRLAHVGLGPCGFRAQHKDRRPGRELGEEGFVLFGHEFDAGEHSRQFISKRPSCRNLIGRRVYF